MIKIERVVTPSPEQWEAIIRGARNPMNRWDKSDSVYDPIQIGEADLSLMEKLVAAGTDHRKFMRMIPVFMDITAPLYWWKEYDTYKVGTVANSCSTMHKIHSKEFTTDDFSCELLSIPARQQLRNTIKFLEKRRQEYNQTKDIRCWNDMVQLLPTSYNQMRTATLNYEVLKNMYRARKNHKLMEWREFCERIEKLPYSNLITG